MNDEDFTPRDLFAAFAMLGLTTNSKVYENTSNTSIARIAYIAYELADTMLEARAVPKENEND